LHISWFSPPLSAFCDKWNPSHVDYLESIGIS
jgi:hypothetical protein